MRFYKLLLGMLLAMTLGVPAMATDDGVDAVAQAATTYEFKSELYLDIQGQKLAYQLPLSVMPWVKMPGGLFNLPFDIDAKTEFYRSADQYIAFYLHRLCAYRASLIPGIFKRSNESHLLSLSVFPKVEDFTPESLSKNASFFVRHDHTLQSSSERLEEDYLRFGIALIEAKGTIKLKSTVLTLNTFFHPLSRLVLMPSRKDCPIEKVIFILADNQQPMRLCGEVNFTADPYIHLEILNAKIRVVHKLLDKVLPVKTEEKAAESKPLNNE